VEVHQQLTPEIKEYSRYLYTAELNNLSPGTTYYLSAGDQANLNSFSEEIKFRTIPMDAEFSFVVGGDNGASHYVKEVSNSMSQATFIPHTITNTNQY
jgi:23S rRNA pseudoU1915 N3-methylase RlmH